MPGGNAYLSGLQDLTLFGTCICSDCWDFFLINLPWFSKLFTSNIPRDLFFVFFLFQYQCLRLIGLIGIFSVVFLLLLRRIDISVGIWDFVIWVSPNLSLFISMYNHQNIYMIPFGKNVILKLLKRKRRYLTKTYDKSLYTSRKYKQLQAKTQRRHPKFD